MLADDLTENATIADYYSQEDADTADLSGASGQVMAKIPKIYYREVFNDDGVLIRVDTAPSEISGYSIHPKFLKADGITERDYIYVGCYEAGDDSSTMLNSASGVAPLTSLPVSTFVSRAAARGDGWFAYDFWTHHLLMLLFYAYYGTLNSQSVLPGYTEASSYDEAYKRNTGRSDELSTMNGSAEVNLTDTDSDLTGIVSEGDAIANKFLFIENIFGHIWKALAGCVFDGRVGEDNTVYATSDPDKFSSTEADILADYENLNIELPADSKRRVYCKFAKSLFAENNGWQLVNLRNRLFLVLFRRRIA